jgi:hypothetical protein
MLVRYFRRPSRIEQLRSSTGGHLLEVVHPQKGRPRCSISRSLI